MAGKTITGKCEQTSKKDKKKKVKFQYAEVFSKGGGGGTLGMTIWVEGEKGGRTNDDIDPNPHDNPKYNKKQKDFYESIASAVAGAKLEDKDGEFPGRGTVLWQGVKYILTKA
mgnify:CR=1 FL=1|jgi:hypothetical protein